MQDVANHVETRNASECQDHYASFYLFGSIGKAVSVPCCSDFSFGLSPSEESMSNHTTLNNATNDNEESESVSLNHKKTLNHTSKSDWALVPVENNHGKRADRRYVFLRDDFEYDNAAESLISSLSVELDDEDVDIAFKLSQVDTYRLRLQEREHRKKLAHEYGLFHLNGGNKFKSPNSKRRTTKSDREVQDKLRILAQFHTFQEHVQYCESLARERDLKNRIRELFRFRKNGLMTLAEVVMFKNRKYKRDKRKSDNKRLDSRLQERRESMVSGELNENLDSQEKEHGGKYDIFYRIRRKLAALFGMTHFLRERKGLSLVAATLTSHTVVPA